MEYLPFLIQPSIQHIVIILALASQHPVSSEVTNILAGTVTFHLLWGAIFSFIMRSLIRRTLIREQPQGASIRYVDCKINDLQACYPSKNAIIHVVVISNPATFQALLNKYLATVV